MKRQWSLTLENDSLPGRHTCSIILPLFEDWLSRRHGNLNFFLTQVFSGHGSFMFFLHKIGKRLQPNCLFCDSASDTVDHTVFDCPAWERDRWKLFIDLEVGDSPSWTTLLGKMLQNLDNWKLMDSFITTIIKHKIKNGV